MQGKPFLLVKIFSLVETFSLSWSHFPTNTPREFHVETTWKRPFPCRFNVESTWCVCRVEGTRTRTNIGLIIMKIVTSLSCHMVNFAFKETNYPGWKNVIEKAWFT